jgi:putative peptidoglycan lipid II flippase
MVKPAAESAKTGAESVKTVAGSAKTLVFKTTGLLMIISFGNKVLGFFREMLMARFYGVSGAVDAFVVASVIPITVFNVIEIGVRTGFVPLYTKMCGKSQKDGQEFAGAVMVFLSILGLLLAALSAIFAPGIVHIFAPGFDQETLELAAALVRIASASIFLRSAMIPLQSFFNARERFLVPATVSLLPNICVVLVMLIWGSTGQPMPIAWVKVSTVFGAFLGLLIMLWSAFRLPAHERPLLRWGHSGLLELGTLAVPVILGMLASDVNRIVDRMMASLLPTGRIAALNYAAKVTSLFEVMFVSSIATVILPILSKHHVRGDKEHFDGLLNRSIFGALMVALPAMALIILFREPIVYVLFQRGEFGPEATALTAGALAFYGLGIVPMALSPIQMRAFHASRDTRTPMLLSFICVAINIGANLLLIKPLGHLGLALATSLSLWTRYFLGGLILKRRGHKIYRSKDIAHLVWIAVGTAIMTAIVYLLGRVLGSPQSQIAAVIQCVLIAVVGLVPYFLIINAKVLKIDFRASLHQRKLIIKEM